MRLAAARGLVLLILLGGCGRNEPDFYVRETGVVVVTDAPFALQPSFPGRLEQVISASLDYWGGDWSQLAGRTITFVGASFVQCGGSTQASGCYDGDVRVSTHDPGVGTVSCAEQTVLAHEIGHAVIGDRMHRDPRWMQFESLGEALAGGSGYAPDGTVDCAIHLSVWRHPPDRT